MQRPIIGDVKNIARSKLRRQRPSWRIKKTVRLGLRSGARRIARLSRKIGFLSPRHDFREDNATATIGNP
jgi:hypothetical protein